MSDKPNYIHPKEIEGELNKLWQKYESSNTIRAALFNLIIYCKKDFRQEYLHEMSQNIIRKHPCRMIIITDFEENKDFLKTYVSDIRPDDEGNRIFCDMVNFEVSGSYLERIPFVVRPHLLPDLPTYLLWGDDPTTENPIAKELEELSTRTIFDSEFATHMTDFASSLLSLKQEGMFDIADLNWARFADWRSLFAAQFNTDDKLHLLKCSKEITIAYNPKATKHFSHNKILSTYFQSWLANAMQWEFDTVLGTREELCFKYHTNSHPVSVTIVPDHISTTIAPGKISKVSIHSYENDFVSFEREMGKSHMVRINRSSSSHCDMPVYHIFDREKTGRSMAREIYEQGTSKYFLKALESISKLQRGIICS